MLMIEADNYLKIIRPFVNFTASSNMTPTSSLEKGSQKQPLVSFVQETIRI